MKLLIVSLLMLSTASPILRADPPEFTFKMVSAKDNSVVIQPVLPIQMKMTKLDGDNPATSFFQCTVLERAEQEGPRHFLKCGTAVYNLDGVLFSR